MLLDFLLLPPFAAPLPPPADFLAEADFPVELLDLAAEPPLPFDATLLPASTAPSTAPAAAPVKAPVAISVKTSAAFSTKLSDALFFAEDFLLTLLLPPPLLALEDFLAEPALADLPVDVFLPAEDDFELEVFLADVLEDEPEEEVSLFDEADFVALLLLLLSPVFLDEAVFFVEAVEEVFLAADFLAAVPSSPDPDFVELFDFAVGIFSPFDG